MTSKIESTHSFILLLSLACILAFGLGGCASLVICWVVTQMAYKVSDSHYNLRTSQPLMYSIVIISNHINLISYIFTICKNLFHLSYTLTSYTEP